jgi:hypothetical protein
MMPFVARTTGRHPKRGRLPSWLIPSGLAVAVLLPACGDQEDASLCTAYGELLAARAEFEATVDPTNLDAEQATEVTENALAGVRRLKQAADDRYGQELDALENAVNDVLLTLESIRDDADIATWGPLVEDDLETARDAAAQVEDAIDPSCNPDASGD